MTVLLASPPTHLLKLLKPFYSTSCIFSFNDLALSQPTPFLVLTGLTALSSDLLYALCSLSL